MSDKALSSLTAVSSSDTGDTMYIVRDANSRKQQVGQLFTSSLFLQSGTGAAARSYLSKARDIINAKDFGVTGDGVTGDSTNINAAILAVNTAGGGIIWFPAGTYVINSTVTLRSKVTLLGVGIDATIFKAANSLNASMFEPLNTATLFSGTSETGEQYWGIERCTIDGNNDNNTSGDAIKTYSRAWRLNQVKITDAAARGINSKWGDGAAYDDDDDRNNDPHMEARLNDVYVAYSRQEGIYWDGPHDSQWSNVLVALSSHDSSGTYDGVYIGANAGGHMATNCHSWGDTQRYAWNIEANNTHFANCEADDAATALIRINANDCTWVGGTQTGGFYATPPAAGDKNLKGFIFGASAFRPFIVTAVRNCPNGAIDFTNAGNLGGNIQILGAIDSALQTAQTGQATYGFQGTLPSSHMIELRLAGVGNNATVHQIPDVVHAADGSASFPAYTFIDDLTTGMYRSASSELAFAFGGAQRVRMTAAGVIVTQGSDPSPVSTRYSADAFGVFHYFEKSRNATVGSHTIVQSGDVLGGLIGQGSNGTGMSQAVQFRMEVDGTPGAANDMPGRAIIATSADGSASPTDRIRVDSSGRVLALTATGGVGYGTGAGGAVTQGTSRTTGVTLNTVCGAITLVSAAGSATFASFTVTNSAVAATDTVVVVQQSGSDLYEIHVTAVAAGSFRVTFRTTGGTTTEQPVFNFAVIKAVTS